MTMFVKNLPFRATEDSIYSLFGDGVKSVRLPTDRETGRVKGFGYVEFSSAGSLDAAVGKSWELEGRELHVDKAGNKPSGMSLFLIELFTNAIPSKVVDVVVSAVDAAAAASVVAEDAVADVAVEAVTVAVAAVVVEVASAPREREQSKTLLERSKRSTIRIDWRPATHQRKIQDEKNVLFSSILLG